MATHTPRPGTSARPPSNVPRWTAADWAVLVGVLLLAAALRLPTLGTWSLWLDEALTVHDAPAVGGSGGAIAASVRTAYPINYWLAGEAMAWWGVNPFAVRLLPCLAGIGSIGVLFAFVRRNAGRATAVLAALFLTMSAWHLFWSQNARHYAPMLLFSLIGAWCGYEALTRRKIGRGVIAVVAILLSLLTHPTAAPLIIVLGVFGVILYAPLLRRVPRPWLLAAGLVVVVIGILGAMHAWPIFYRALRAKSGGNLPYFLATVVHYVEPPMLLAAAAGVVLAWKVNRTWGGFLLLYAFLPLAAISVCALIMDLGALYIFLALPAFCTLSAHAAVGLWRTPYGSPLAGLLVGTIVLVHQAGETMMYFTHRYGDRPRWAEAAAYLEHVGAAHDEIVSTGAPPLAFHMGYPPPSLRTPTPIIWLGKWNWEDVMATPGPRWLVVKDDRLVPADPEGKIRAWIAKRAILVKRLPAWTSVKDRTILIYRVEDAGLPPSS